MGGFPFFFSSMTKTFTCNFLPTGRRLTASFCLPLKKTPRQPHFSKDHAFFFFLFFSVFHFRQGKHLLCRGFTFPLPMRPACFLFFPCSPPSPDQLRTPFLPVRRQPPCFFLFPARHTRISDSFVPTLVSSVRAHFPVSFYLRIWSKALDHFFAGNLSLGQMPSFFPMFFSNLVLQLPFPPPALLNYSTPRALFFPFSKTPDLFYSFFFAVFLIRLAFPFFFVSRAQL